ncbi:MAG: acetoacetate--CoA ligase [Pseudomonadota bacterium]|nr:acetoacetate--CoA ligase [Pseudomonadota bacterium]
MHVRDQRDAPLWTPSPSRAGRSNMMRFLQAVRERLAPWIRGYSDLHRWSVDHPETFWPEVWRFCGVIASRPWTDVLPEGDRMPGARWFVGARLNFAENLLRFRDDRPALVFRREDGLRSGLSYRELYGTVARMTVFLMEAGVREGDRVAGILPNRPEAVVAMLAATGLGALWSSCSPDFGEVGILDRFGQIGPKILFVSDGYRFKGRSYRTLERASHLLKALPTIEQVVLVGGLEPEPDLSMLPGAIAFDSIVSGDDAPDPAFRQLPFDHPVYILYSSGTTGRPKCIVHGAGGTLLQHLKELLLHTALRREDRFFYFTTCGWMMWNWLISGLAAGATLVLYDGAPLYPRPDALFDLAEEEGISVFGTSAKYLASVEKAGVIPARTHRLERLRTVLSTGSPLAPESFDYVYRDVKADLQLASISGGTDIISCFALGNPLLPVYRGQLQCRGLGMKVEVFDDEGHSVVGRRGELVCTAPFPSMPVGFWNDPDNSKYHATYFKRYLGVWAHGDWAELTPREGLIIHGRSDAVLNPGGVRIGTAEIYRQVERLPEVLESIAVGQDWQDDVRIILFVVLREDLTLDRELRETIRAAIRDNTSSRHVPAKVIQVNDIPRTRSGKLTELAVRDLVHGRPVKNVDALANPEALEQFRGLEELEA